MDIFWELPFCYKNKFSTAGTARIALIDQFDKMSNIISYDFHINNDFRCVTRKSV